MNKLAGQRRSVSGRSAISSAFAGSLSLHKAALMPYYPLGYPDIKTSMEVIQAISPVSDLIELGIPFSDPIADGPTIQRSTQKALEVGVNTRLCLDMVAELRSKGIQTPLLLMSYYNPILAFGEDHFVTQMASAGADGLIVPDLPPEEAGELRQLMKQAGLSLINFVAPTSSEHRIRQILLSADGFIYMVSVTGVTGALSHVSTSLPEFVRLIKRKTEVPVAVGFGISTAEQATRVATFADGIIVGSALIDVVDADDDKPAAALDFITELRKALR